MRVNDPHIYVITASASFRRLQHAQDRCGDLDAARKIASVLVHEEVHLKHKSDEADAYAAQLTTLNSLGAGAGTRLYSEIKRSMQHVLAQPRTDALPVMVVR